MSVGSCSVRRLLPLALLVGCVDSTAIIVEVDAPDLALGALDRLRFVAEGESGTMATHEVNVPGDWPQTFAFRGGSASDGENVEIEVLGLQRGRVRLRRTVQARIDKGDTVRVTVTFRSSCLDVACEGNSECVEGACGMPSSGTDAGPPSDAAVDAGEARDAATDSSVPLDGSGPDDGAMPVDGVVPDDGSVPVDGFAPIDSFVPVDSPGAAGPTTLLLSEYVEGSGSDKAVEIYNPFPSAQSCVLELYSNGRTGTPSTSDDFTAEPGVTVLCNGGARFPAAAGCESSPAANFNGNDALVLRCDGAVVDVFGQLGNSTPWAEDVVLHRRCTVTMGDTNADDAFGFEPEWEVRTFGDVSDLGRRGCP